MRRRLVGLAVSVALAAAGTMLLVGYVQSAHEEAAAAEPMAEVLVVTEEIPRGTKAEDLDGKVKLRQIEERSVLDGAVSSAGELKGKVAMTTLLPGEQVLAARFQTPAVLGRDGVPPGLLEVTVQLSADRALGGNIRAGDTVAVLSSFEPFDLETNGLPADAPKKTPNTTHLILHKVLVTNVQATEAVKEDGDDKEGDDRPRQAPRGHFLVTLAVDATSAQRIVFSAEFGKLWLSAEPSDAPDATTRVETRGTVY